MLKKILHSIIRRYFRPDAAVLGVLKPNNVMFEVPTSWFFGKCLKIIDFKSCRSAGQRDPKQE